MGLPLNWERTGLGCSGVKAERAEHPTNRALQLQAGHVDRSLEVQTCDTPISSH